MSKIALISVTALVAVAGLAAPALAASSTSADRVPFCPTGNDSKLLNERRDALAEQMQLSSKAGSSIDIWNGCLQVTTTVQGKTRVYYIDPDSFRVVAER